ncbi:molybdenum cofactor guanylyltransferase [Oscillochloris sp. ZM17-4]|uniref:molybdenum cofactor guanylyltransferase n=1 Tax=Oscillochloris sp. ZM17-4 TaxID=2866714 RepID=UPI001C737559|nr:molybdenum cofactor guanylyltransferase [Oscillochloris sp. ZM17-4]MBX0330753.1 molybdenum cofactor guanylyltransferase [Oscillochloris sp. ZM17-4]
MAITGIIVAGGRSRRLGFDKRRVRLWGDAGPTLLEHTLGVLAPLCAELLVVLNDPAEWPGLAARVVGDRYPDAGALGGIYSGLTAAALPTALVVASDMPLLNAGLLRALAESPFDGDALVPLAVGPASRSGREPLHAVYRASCLPAMRAALECGSYGVAALLARLQMAIPDQAMIACHDPGGRAMLNINTPDDLALARRLIAGV